MPDLTSHDQKKQELYRDARLTDQYDAIWQSVDKCVFCDLREKYVFFEENGIVMTISLYAYIDGHFMIVPRRHVRSARELTQAEWDTIRKFFYIAKKMVKQVHGVKGMQIVQKDGSAAQSTVEHLHFHCVPFDAPDLCAWNYRELKYTPLENVALYKADKKKLLAYDTKYTQKYANRSSLPVICDVVIFNTHGQVLLQERAEADQFIPNYLSLPGGSVENFNLPLQDELRREVSEEIGYLVETADLALVDSRVGNLERRAISRQLGLSYPQKSQFMWNTYVLSRFPADTMFKAGDDCREIVWLDVAGVGASPRISFELKKVIAKAWKIHRG